MTGEAEKRSDLRGIFTILCALSLTFPTVAINQCYAIVASFSAQEEQETETKPVLSEISQGELRHGLPKPSQHASKTAPAARDAVRSVGRIADLREILASQFLSLRC